MSRSLEHVEFKVNEAGEILLRCMCDCGSITDVTLVGFSVIPDRSPQELAFTCDGCGTSHWFTIGAAEQRKDGA